MPADVQISFRGMAASPSVEAQVRHRAEELQRFSDRITACRVMLEGAHRHHRQGKIYHVSVDLTVPGGEVVVNREPGVDHAHEDLHVAIRDAFDAARRQLQDHMHRLDGKMKQHETPAIGRIVRVFAERDYGFLETDGGNVRPVRDNTRLPSIPRTPTPLGGAARLASAGCTTTRGKSLSAPVSSRSIIRAVGGVPSANWSERRIVIVSPVIGARKGRGPVRVFRNAIRAVNNEVSETTNAVQSRAC